MLAPHTPKQNHLLAALPAADYERLLPHLELVPLPLAWGVYEAGDAPGYVVFPTTSIVSLLYVMEDGSSAEIAVVGNEGLVGIALFMGGGSTPSRAVVQSAGYALQPRQDHRAGPSDAGSTGLRVLCGGQTGIRSFAFPRDRDR